MAWARNQWQLISRFSIRTLYLHTVCWIQWGDLHQNGLHFFAIYQGALVYRAAL